MSSIEDAIEAAVARGIAAALAKLEQQPLLLSRSGVARMLSVSLDTVDNLRSRGVIPKPIYLGEGARPKPLWDKRDIVAAIDKLKTEQKAKPPAI